jgi:hypothetical protein
MPITFSMSPSIKWLFSWLTYETTTWSQSMPEQSENRIPLTANLLIVISILGGPSFIGRLCRLIVSGSPWSQGDFC